MCDLKKILREIREMLKPRLGQATLEESLMEWSLIRFYACIRNFADSSRGAVAP